MKIKLFCVFDVKANAYLPPFVLPTTEMAIRTFSDTVNDTQHAFAAHPEDYTLFEIATFEDDNAELLSHQTKVPLGNGMDFRNPSSFDDVEITMMHERIDEMAGMIGDMANQLNLPLEVHKS